jgi:cyclophilin family peptidyl-prolyl cis-trans isomerase
VRRAAVTALGAILGLRGQATLATRLEDPSPYVAAAALTAFAAAAGTSATPTLIARTDPGQPSPVRIAAVAALADSADPERAAVLRHLATDEDYVVAATAAEALAAIDDRSAEPALIAAAARERGFAAAEARVAALAALGRLGSGRAAAAIRPALRDPDPRVRTAAVAACDSLAARGVVLDQKLRSSAANEAKRLAADKEPPLGAVPDGLAPPAPPERARARLVTPRGAVELELLPAVAPLAVANFIALATGGFYASGVFHRVVPDFVVQGGCPRADGYGGPDYALRAEPSPEEYGVGTLGMADAGPGTAGSQFFLTHSPVARLERRYTVFGRVTAGLAALEQIQLGDSFQVEILPAADADR